MNTIIGGNYKGAKIKSTISGGLKMSFRGRTAPLMSSVKSVKSLGKSDNVNDAVLGAWLFGTKGAIVGAAHGTWLVEIRFKSGKKSLAEVDGTIYKLIVGQAYKGTSEYDEPPAGVTNNFFTNIVAVIVVVLAMLFFAALILGSDNGGSKPQWQKDMDDAMQSLTPAKQLELAQVIFIESQSKDGAFTAEQYEYMSNTYEITCKYKNKKKEVLCLRNK